MKNDVTRSTATRPLPLRPVVPGDAYCKNHPPDASPDFDPFSQLTETEQLKHATINNLTHTKNMRLRLLTPAPDPRPLPPPRFFSAPAGRAKTGYFGSYNFNSCIIGPDSMAERESGSKLYEKLPGPVRDSHWPNHIVSAKEADRNEIRI